MTLTNSQKPEQAEKAEKSLIGWTILGIAGILSVIVVVLNIVAAYGNSGKTEAAVASVEAEAAPLEETTETEPAIIINETAEAAEEEMISTEPVEYEAEPITEVEWHFYNADIQSNGTATDDYNFGPNPVYENINLDQVKQAISGKSPSDSVKVESLISAAETMVMDQDFRERMRHDPALGAADMAWFDSLLGTRYLGVFYDECEKEWDAAMNKAKEQWIEDPEDYSQTLDAFFKYLDSATKVEVKSVNKKLSDQMYMNPYTKSGVPDIVVLKTDDHSGWYLTYTFTIKETKTIEVMYRVDCGYQPTDVAKVMNVKAKTKSSITGGGGSSVVSGGGGKAATTTTVISGGGGNPGSNPNPNPGPGPGPGPNPNPTPKKDPTKGTVVQPNDDQGPGENTNTGKGGQYSSKDNIGNSNDLTPGEYKETIGEMEDANKNNGDGKTPTTEAPSSDTKVDNPGATDSGKTETSHSSVDNDNAGDSWDGPPD